MNPAEQTKKRGPRIQRDSAASPRRTPRQSASVGLKMYNALAEWWPLLSPPEHYRDEARFFAQLFNKSGLPTEATFLELGCGGGSNAFFLKPLFASATLTDISPAMLAVSRGINPECEHVEGDMRALRLGRQFDVVFAHDAIDYMTSSKDLKLAIATAYEHCKPGGIALFVPDYVRETFSPSTSNGGTDGEGRGMRYLEWVYDPDEGDCTYEMAFAFMLRDGTSPLKVDQETHVHGLFSRGEWLAWLEDAGFEYEIVEDSHERNLFLCRKTVAEATKNAA